jgi:hypothetical protein
MTLPNFLGIGALRSGSSWLNEQLRNHREIFIPVQKELNFFTEFYESGIDWYAGHFPASDKAASYKAIGEITPTYVGDPRVPARIHRHLPDCRLILILRNPIERAYSEYTKAMRDSNFRGSFDDLVEQKQGLLARGDYSQHLARYLEWFPRDRFLILIFETMISDHRGTAQKLGQFLGIDPDGFDIVRMQRQVNASYLPRLPGLFSAAIKVRNSLTRNRLGWVTAVAADLGLAPVARRLFRFGGPRAALPALDEPTRRRLEDHYAPEIERLERLLDQDLSLWKASDAVGSERRLI